MSDTTKLRKQIGARVAALREARGEQQNELAGRLRLDLSSLCLIESGKRAPSLNTLCDLAHALGVAPAYFIVPEPAPSPRPESTTREQVEEVIRELDVMHTPGMHDNECPFAWPHQLEEGDECHCGTREMWHLLVSMARLATERSEVPASSESARVPSPSDSERLPDNVSLLCNFLEAESSQGATDVALVRALYADARRLDWLESEGSGRGWTIMTKEDGWHIQVISRGRYHSLRQAIDKTRAACSGQVAPDSEAK